MIIDSSAIIALLCLEPTATAIARELAAAPVKRIGAPAALEVSLVIDSRPSTAAVEPWAEVLGSLEVVPFEADDFAAARAAHRRFGRGSGSPARLNFGDCMSYAIAKRFREPLLYVGEDFAATDIDSVL